MKKVRHILKQLFTILREIKIMRFIITLAFTAVLTITFASCGKKGQVSILEIVDKAQYGDTHAYAEWQGRYWEVFGNRGDAKFSALTTRIYTTSFDSIKKVIDDEFGPCEYSKANMPKDLISEDGFYWHLSRLSCDDVYYWSNDTLSIAWALFEVQDDYGYAYLDIERSPLPWVRELEYNNPLRNDTNYISVYFRFDTIINNFEVSGIFYPTYDEDNETDYYHGWFYEVGARLFFRNVETGKDYVWTDYEESCHCFKRIFSSKNIDGIITADGFRGFKNGDTYIFDYNTFVYDDAENPFCRYAEYQFLDVDNDGKDELLLGYYGGGPHGITLYEAYKMTDSGLVSTSMTFDEHSHVNFKRPAISSKNNENN